MRKNIVLLFILLCVLFLVLFGNIKNNLLDMTHIKNNAISMPKMVSLKNGDSNILHDDNVAHIKLFEIVKVVDSGNITIELSINTEMYNDGSFRSFNGYRDASIRISNSNVPVQLVGYNYNIWSPSGFPSTELYYAFNGTLLAEVPQSVSKIMKKGLLDAGFIELYTTSNTTFYSKALNENGIVNLYRQ